MYYWIIESNLELQELYKLFLSSQGHEVDCFLSAEDALQALSDKKNKPDICVIDYTPTGQNELFLSRLLHQLDGSSKIIFSISDLEVLSEIRKNSSVILQKPFRLKELLFQSS